MSEERKTNMDSLRCPLCRNPLFKPVLYFKRTHSYPRFVGVVRCLGANCDYESDEIEFDEVADLMADLHEWQPIEEERADAAMRTRLVAIRDRIKFLEKNLVGPSNSKDLCGFMIDVIENVLDNKDPFEEREENDEP